VTKLTSLPDEVISLGERPMSAGDSLPADAVVDFSNLAQSGAAHQLQSSAKG
jgi:hypothetical protein